MAPAILKTCATCGHDKNFEEFNLHRCQPDGLRRVCKGCQSNQNRASYIKGQAKWQDKARERRREWRKSPENVEKNRRACAEWYAADPVRAKEICARWGKANPELKKAADREWRRENLAIANSNSKRYKASRLKATPIWADQIAIRAFYLQAQMLTQSTGVVHHVDHIYPLRSPLVCGLHHEANLRVIPWIENLKKGNRFISE